MKRFLFITILCLLLTGCHIGMVALLGMGAAGGYYYGKDKRSWVQMTRDQSISSEINTALYRQAGVPTSKIQVYTYQGRVILEGTVKTSDALERVIDIARNTRGVTDVQSQLRVVSPYD